MAQSVQQNKEEQKVYWSLAMAISTYSKLFYGYLTKADVREITSKVKGDKSKFAPYSAQSVGKLPCREVTCTLPQRKCGRVAVLSTLR